MADKGRVDISWEFTCFLCNGYQTQQGSLRLDPEVLQIVNYHGMLLEQFPYSNIVCVSDEEPPTEHSLIIHLRSQRIYVSHLLRKEKLVKYFSDNSLFKDDFRVSAKSLGFIGADRLSETTRPSSELFNDPPDIDKVLRNLSLQLGQRVEEEQSVSSIPKKTVSKKKKVDEWPKLHPSNQQMDNYQHPHDLHTKRQPLKELSNNGPPQTPQFSTEISPAPDAQRTVVAQHLQPSTDTNSQLIELQMLFPNHAEEQLLQALAASNNNTDVAVSNIFAADSNANARSASSHT